MFLVDSNVLLDLVTDDPVWADWSSKQLESASLSGPIFINDVIYSEVSIRYRRVEDLEAMLAEAQIDVLRTPKAALFLAGKAFERYRRSGGVRTGVLPDFFIGAHAAVSDMILITRDVARYRSYFPRIELLTPGMSKT